MNPQPRPSGLMWRWMVGQPSDPRVVLCDGSGKVILSSQGRSLSATATSSGFGQWSFEVSSTAAALGVNWGISPLVIETSSGGYSIAGYEFTLNELQALAVQRCEFEVFAPNYSRPFGAAVSNYIVEFGIPVGYDEAKTYDSGGAVFNTLVIGTPDDEFPSDPYFINLWVSWLSDNFTTPLRLSSYGVANPSPDLPSLVIPSDAAVSFGNLIPMFA